jgi:hypothetical protein
MLWNGPLSLCCVTWYLKSLGNLGQIMKIVSKVKVVWEGNHFVFLKFGLWEGGGGGFEIFIIYKNEIAHYHLMLSHVKPHKFKVKI